jgi:hypothetical protein
MCFSQSLRERQFLSNVAPTTLKSTNFNNRLNLVRDLGVGGPNPLSPTILFIVRHPAGRRP